MTSRDIGRIAAVVVFGGLVLMAIARPSPQTATAPSRASVERSGTGIMSTDRFPLQGDYRMDWTATGDGRYGCYHGFHVRPGLEGSVSVSVEGGQPASGTTYAYGLDAGMYYLEANSGCAWTVRLVPI